jgi:hypothetical protein
MRPTVKVWLTLATILTASLTTLTPANAAVRKCGPGVTSDITAAPNEFQGKRKALLSWTMKAVKLGGPAFASWRIADKKVLGCKRGKTSADGVQCVAYANPCAIVQASPPGKQGPQNKLPARKRRLGGNVPFEI